MARHSPDRRKPRQGRLQIAILSSVRTDFIGPPRLAGYHSSVNWFYWAIKEKKKQVEKMAGGMLSHLHATSSRT